MNFKELKEFCNTLTEEQLQEPVIVWREEEAIQEISPEILEQDYYIGDGDTDGCYPLDEAGLTLEDAKEQNLRIVYSKGTPILWAEF